jgi:tetratricopeptide (TPR) repeat protein
MTRWFYALALGSVLAMPARAQDQPKQQKVEQEPPEEDANLKAPRDYAFNPLQANKELQVGLEYFKRHSYKAAAGRFREATKWNPNLAEAWLRLGEAEEKRKNREDAKEAYTKYLELQPESKDAAEIRKKVASLH